MRLIHGIQIGLLGACLWGGDIRAGSGWTSYGQILELQPTTAGRFLLRMHPASNPSGCRDEDWFYRDYTGMGVELMFHALLGAVTNGIPVRLYVTGNCDLNGYAEISAAGVGPASN